MTPICAKCGIELTNKPGPPPGSRNVHPPGTSHYVHPDASCELVLAAASNLGLVRSLQEMRHAR